MDHDRELLERLSAFTPVPFDGEVFRATRLSLNALAPSTIGGRWMVPGEAATLYTSMEADGALAEIAFHWGQMIPIARLKCDGLIAPSARWPCENVMVFLTNQTGEQEIARFVASEQVDWQAWARDKGVAVPPT